MVGLVPANRNRAVLFPAELNVFKVQKNNSPNFSIFLLVVQVMMQIKFNFNNFIFYGVPVTAWQRASGIGLRRRRWRL